MKKMKREKGHYVVKNKISIFYQLRDLLLTLMLWGLWGYIFYPLIALILWKYFDMNIFYDKSPEDIQLLEESLYLFVISAEAIIFLLTMAFNGWGYYNKQRFKSKGNKRRNQPESISSEMMGKALQVDEKYIDKCKNARYIQIYHTEKSPESQEDIFKSINSLDVESVNVYFSDDWDKVRKSSNFGYTHIAQEKGE